jgi:hypothetical protein
MIQQRNSEERVAIYDVRNIERLESYMEETEEAQG